MEFASILYETSVIPNEPDSVSEPDFFHDLNLDRVITDLLTGREEYRLNSLFFQPPDQIETTVYRQEVMRDVEQADVRALIQSFSQKMRAMREQRARIDKLHYRLQKERVFLDAVSFYCDAVAALRAALLDATLKSSGLSAFRNYVHAYVQSDAFSKLKNEMEYIRYALSSVEYQILIHQGSITVSRRGQESDYNTSIENTFARFRENANKQYDFKLTDYPEMNHIEAGIVDFVADLYPEIFSLLGKYYSEHQSFLDAVIARWDREIHFYVCFLDYICPLQADGLDFSYPVLSAASKTVNADKTFDIALAHKLAAERRPVVTNDFALNGVERIMVVSGPNQGGKTTFARTFGQLHYLGRLGYPVPGTNIHLLFYDHLLTHFEKEEDIHTHRGKLEDEITRINAILGQATSQSIVILNEVFASTTLNDALFLARAVLERLMNADVLCVCVTFIEELSSLGPATVSFVSTVLPSNPSQRTLRVVRKIADGRSYAMSLAEKYRVSYQALKERLSS